MSKNYSELTDELYQEFLDFYDHVVPDPVQHPMRFEFLVKTFLVCRSRQKGKELTV